MSIIPSNTERLAPSSSAFHTGMKPKRTMIHLSNWQRKLRSSFRLRRRLVDFWWTSSPSVRNGPLQRIILLISATVRYVPSWLPGAGFQKTAASWASTLYEMVEQPHNFVKQQIVKYTSDTGLYNDQYRVTGRWNGCYIFFVRASGEQTA